MPTASGMPRAETSDVKRVIASALNDLAKRRQIEPDTLIAALGCIAIERAERSPSYRTEIVRREFAAIAPEFARIGQGKI